MDAPTLRRSGPRSPFSPRHAAAVLALILLTSGATQADPAPARYELNASLQKNAAAQTGAGLHLQARLAPSLQRAEGGGYAVEAVVSPTAACGDDAIFANGFEL